MKLIDLPDYAKKYKTKGFDVRLVGENYALYKITSRRVPDKTYPVLIQEYIGIIDKEKGLLKKKTSSVDTSYLEYGLSHMILSNFKIILMRTISVMKEDYALPYIKLAIINYINNSMSDVSIKTSFISKNCFDELVSIRDNGNQIRLKKIINKIDSEMKLKFDKDLNDVIILLKLVVIPSNEEYPSPYYNEEVLSILKKHGVKLWEKPAL